MNSNSLFTTVFRNLQWALRNLGYWPTMYMMLEAMMALLSFPFFCSHSPSKSLITVTRNLFSSSSCIDPEMDPMAQHNVFKFFQDHSLPFTWLASFSVMNSLTTSPWSFSTTRTSSGLAILEIMMNLTL